MTRGWRALPLPAWAAIVTGGTTLTALLVVGLVLVAAGHLDTPTVVALVGGVVAAALGTCLAVLAGQHLAGAVHVLHHDALRRLSEPAAPVSSPQARPLATRVTRELTELARTLDALHLRVRVADELGRRHQRDAEAVGAGVFELLSGLVAAEEGARGQLAAELHDTVAQSLMIARGMLDAQPTAPADLVRLADYVADAEEQVRAVMARTRPPALRDGDLASAVSMLRADFEARYGLAVHITWPHEAHPLPLAAAVTIYRFLQEALLNVVKHADVDDAEVRLVVGEQNVVVTVHDDGPGFDPSAVRPDRGRHVGLGLLRERARLAGGAVEVDSAEGAGTTLRLRLPRAAMVPPPDAEVPEQRHGLGTALPTT